MFLVFLLVAILVTALVSAFRPSEMAAARDRTVANEVEDPRRAVCP